MVGAWVRLQRRVWSLVWGVGFGGLGVGFGGWCVVFGVWVSGVRV